MEKPGNLRDLEGRAVKERKLDILVLMKNYLIQEGYIETVRSLEAEARLPIDYVLCDNLDLNTVVEDYEYYYHLRFQKYPRIVKKVDGGGGGMCQDKRKEKRKFAKVRQVVDLKQESSILAKSDLNNDCLTINSLGGGCQTKCEEAELKLWRGLGNLPGYSDEWKFFADIISKEVIDRNLNVKWSDVIGLDSAKELLKEAIVYPTKYVDLFKDVISPWKGLLLYGPSGTGKTLLAKAVATECKTTFFNISASSIVSKWRGESEKLVRVMFELARHQAPSTIFIDEVDALASKRDGPHEHEASRRLKTELLVQMDGLLETEGNIFLLTTSNLPWDLDHSILRRLEKRIFVDLPDEGARRELFAFHLPPKLNKYISTKVDYGCLAQKSSGYSGADIKLVCKEAIMQALRPLFPLLESPARVDTKTWMAGTVIGTESVLTALDRTKPTISDVSKFKTWAAEHGSD